MTASDELYKLIKSLSKHEKSYVSKFLTLFVEKESSNYLKLFSELERQALLNKEYDECILKKINFSGKFLKNLSVHKNYLFNMIMTSLSLYNKDNKNIILLRQLITQSELLIDKMLYNQARKVLQRARKTALESDYLFYIIEIMNLEKALNTLTADVEDCININDKLSEDQLELLETAKNDLAISMIYDKYAYLNNKTGTGFLRSEDEFAKMKSLFESEFLKDENTAGSFSSKLKFYLMHLQLNISKNDYEQAYNYSSKIVALHEANINKSGGSLEKYINSLNNLITCLIRLKRFDECLAVINKLNNVERDFPKFITDKNKVFIFHSTSVLSISMYLGSGDFKELHEHVKKVESKLSGFENKIPVKFRIVLYYFLAISNFVMSNYEKCVDWSGKIINMQKTGASQDYQCYVRILNLICYYELGYSDAIEHALKSAYRFLSKHKRVYKYENIILKYLRKSFRIHDKDELYEMFEYMKLDLEEIYDDTFERNAFDAFNILIWLESKLNKKTVLEVMKANKY